MNEGVQRYPSLLWMTKTVAEPWRRNVVQCSTLGWCSGTQIGLIVGTRDYILKKHGVTPDQANEALSDPEQIPSAW